MAAEMEMEAAEMTAERPEPERAENGLIPALHEPDISPIPGIYGWKKRCLYFSLLLLLVLILVNLGLTLWIIFVLDFNAHGMGNLRITDSGLRLQGRAEFTDTLYAETIASDQDKSLLLQSQKSVEITSGDSRMSLSPEELTLTSPTFSVYTHDSASASPGDQPPVLSVSNQSVTISADSLQVGGPLGLTVEAGVETSSVRPQPGRDLSLEAGGGRLQMVGGEGGLNIEGGFTGGSEGVDISSNADLLLSSRHGAIVLSSSSIVLENVPITDTSSSDTVMEVCACGSGKLYLVPALSTQGCQDDNSICNS